MAKCTCIFHAGKPFSDEEYVPIGNFYVMEDEKISPLSSDTTTANVQAPGANQFFVSASYNHCAYCVGWGGSKNKPLSKRTFNQTNVRKSNHQCVSGPSPEKPMPPQDLLRSTADIP